MGRDMFKAVLEVDRMYLNTRRVAFRMGRPTPPDPDRHETILRNCCEMIGSKYNIKPDKLYYKYILEINKDHSGVRIKNEVN